MEWWMQTPSEPSTKDSQVLTECQIVTGQRKTNIFTSQPLSAQDIEGLIGCREGGVCI